MEPPSLPQNYAYLNRKEKRKELGLLKKEAKKKMRTTMVRRMREARSTDPRVDMMRRVRQLGHAAEPHWPAVVELFFVGHSPDSKLAWHEVRCLLGEILFYGDARHDAERLGQMLSPDSTLVRLSTRPEMTRTFAHKFALDAIVCGAQLAVSHDATRPMDVKGWNPAVRELRCTEATAGLVRELLDAALAGDETSLVGPVGDRPNYRADLAIQCFHALTAMGGRLAEPHILAYATPLHSSDVERSESKNEAKRNKPRPTPTQQERVRVACVVLECLTHLAKTGALSDEHGTAMAQILAGERGLSHWDWGVRTRAATALGALGSHAEPHIEALTKALHQSPSDKPRRVPFKQALEALGRADIVESIARNGQGYLTSQLRKGRMAEARRLKARSSKRRHSGR